MLRTERRVRLLVNGACLADTIGTTGAIFVWEHEYYPQLYLHRSALIDKIQGYNITYENKDHVKDVSNTSIATTLKVKVERLSDHHTKEIDDGFMVFEDDLTGKAEDLRGMLKVQFSAAGEFYLHPSYLQS